jgi:hypothetical protein
MRSGDSLTAQVVALLLAFGAAACAREPPPVRSECVGVEGWSEGMTLGMAVEFLSDIDGDRIADVVVSAPGEGPFDGILVVASAMSGRVLHVIDELGERGALGRAIATGDFVGDERLDIAVAIRADASSGGAAVVLIDGRNWSLASVPIGVPDAIEVTGIATIADLDDDGRDDLILTGWGRDAYFAIVRSSESGRVLHRLPVAGSDGRLDATAVGDVDADGFEDFAIVRPFLVGIRESNGLATVYSGRTGASLLAIQPLSDERMSGALCGLGDVDADGHADLVFAVARAAKESSMLRVVSGASGARLVELEFGTRDEITAVSLASVGDLDSDGIADFLAGDPMARLGDSLWHGEAAVFSPSTGARLLTLSARQAGLFGTSAVGVAGSESLPEGVLALLAIGEPWYGDPVDRAGRVHVVRIFDDGDAGRSDSRGGDCVVDVRGTRTSN